MINSCACRDACDFPQCEKVLPNDVSVSLLYGGTGFTEQVNKLKNGVDVVVGTPGRIMDLMERVSFFCLFAGRCFGRALLTMFPIGVVDFEVE